MRAEYNELAPGRPAVYVSWLLRFSYSTGISHGVRTRDALRFAPGQSSRQ